MKSWLASLCLQRVVLPLALTAGASLRQNGMSALYLILLLYNPAVPVPTPRTMAGHTGFYQKLVILFTVLNIFSSFIFQIVLISYPPYGELVKPDCGWLANVLRYFGLVRLDELDHWTQVRLLTPEVVLLVVSISVYWGCALLNPAKTIDERLLPIVNAETEPGQPPPSSADSVRKLNLLTQFGKYVVLASLCFAGSLRPSALSGFYFLLFLILMTVWACNKPLGRPFAYFSRCLLIFVAAHIIALFLYQMDWAQTLLPPNAPIPRYLGLTALVNATCESDPRVVHFTHLEWASYACPFTLVWLYLVLWYEANLIINAPLIRGRESVYRRGVRRRNLLQDSTGSVTISEVPEDGTKLDNVSEEEEEGGVGVLEMIVNTGITIGQLLAQSSYIATNIIMMTWSITYHSWLTFVLLLWAMVMWLMPNQRKAMLRSSPFLSLYAQFLLIAQYIYGMDLNDDELPQTIKGVNLKQIGFEKILYLPVKPIIIKSLFSVIFWITLKQYNQEKWEARNQSTLNDITSPVQIGVSAAAGIESDAQTKTNQMIQNIGTSVKGILTKYWIWVVACTLFGIGITGARITIFRIVYMALALIFILTFQLSWALWRKMMYGFWLTVIIYSMLILVMTYTYQFDNFPDYWTEYLHINETLQLDIGMEKFETSEPFVILLTPTLFVIITVIQLYYFHKDFLAISDIKSRGSSSVRPRVSQASSTLPSSAMDPSTSSQRKPSSVYHKQSFHFLHALSHVKIQLMLNKLQEWLSIVVELIWLFLELHMLKLIFFLVMLLSVYDVCALHIIFVLLAVIATSLGSKAQTFAAHAFSALVSILLLAKMIYQIKYIEHGQWSVTCPTEDMNKTFHSNTAEWIGFRKTGNDSLAYLLRGYIAVIIIVTIHSVVVTRQKHQRHMKGRSLNRPHIMFPRISYKEVDKDIKSCIKYLFNYGFYRFGVEVCLISVVILIGMRMDFYAVLYAFWLCLIITPRRNVLAKIWPIFQFFIITSISLQYLFVVGLPPNLCIFYPWESPGWLKHLQEWMFLPTESSKLPAYKLLCDFLVLMVVCRQGVVFRIEHRHTDREYHGGTNKSIICELERPGFKNPTPDFISLARSWLDIVKRIVFSLFIWVTLAIVFLAGTNRVNIFSLGYLIGAFIFLWQGNDFFLRPMRIIITWWNYLISYNVTVILLKSILQIVGCVFVDLLPSSTCLLIQIFGIGCIRKFGDNPPDLDELTCHVPKADIGLAWDGFCFGFLILQRRLFNSYYFFHIIDETKAMAILASRGAELIEELSRKQIQEQLETERNILEKIKNKMDRIKASQQKSQGPSYKEPASHAAAIRSGDYYMFDDVDEEELDLICEGKSSTDEDDEGAQVDKSRTDVFKLLSTAMKTDIEAATEMAKSSHSRRSSVPSGPLRSSLYRRSLRSVSVTERPPTVSESVAADPIWRSCSSLPPSPDSEAKPGPSHAHDDEDDEKEDKRPPKDGDDDSKKDEQEADKEDEKEVSLLNKALTVLKFLWCFVNSLMVTLTRYLNKFSRDYRYVIKTLTIEKKELKERSSFGEGIRVGTAQVWQPHPVSLSETKHSPIKVEELDEEHELSAAEQPPFIRLILAIWYAVISHSELVCYFTIFLHQIRSPTLLSIPLPLMVFFWGTLTVPRPSKKFWVTIIAYTEVVVIIKCIFQFEGIQWDHKGFGSPFYFPRIVGIERQPGMYAYYDLLLLLIVFFHRSMLKSLGLWKTYYSGGTKDGSSSKNGCTPSSMSHAVQESQQLGVQAALPPTQQSSVSDLALTAEEGDIVRIEDSKLSLSSGTQSKGSDKDLVRRIPNVPPLFARIITSMRCFFAQILEPSVQVTADVYAYMFMCDFINFLVVIFGFSSFGSQQGETGVAEYFEENKVPIAFLVMLILQFALIVIDRTLYLRKYILGKVIFQFMLVIGIHIWMFLVLPAVTERSFNAGTPPQIWYMVKCIYLLLSAYQIRSGYPTRILGNFLCKSYNYMNMFLFKVFMSVPFVFELRALMDWIWTDTSMTLSDWLKMEDIFAHIFQLKCQRRAEAEYPQPRGEKKPALHKYLVGGGCLIGIIAVIWFPLVLFALGNTVGKPNLPMDVTATVRIGAFQPIYKYSAQNNSIYTLSPQDWDYILNKVYQTSPKAQSFLSGYEYDDVGVVKLSPHSTSVWTISPPDNQTLIEELKSNQSLPIKLELTISRIANPDQPGLITSGVEITLPPKERQNLITMLTVEHSETKVKFNNLLPKFIKVVGKGSTKFIDSLMIDRESDGTMKSPYRDLEASLNSSVDQFWWELTELCPNDFLRKLPYMDCKNLIMYTFNDKAFPTTLNIISGKGIVGLYTTFVILIHSIIRQFFTGISFKIMFDDMPCVDRLLQLCLDIYLVRESGELDLEEDLFAKLVFLYRSPETLIKWTRPLEEEAGEDDPDNIQQ